jgi:GT2 family glycosyltransferase
MDDSRLAGVSFVVPVRNGEAWLAAALTAILAQDDGRPLEVIVVDDGSSDGSPSILAGFARDPRVRLVHGEGRGAAAAINLGLREARYALIAQVDQDVLLESGWLIRLVAELADPIVAAAQGYYRTPRDASVFARVTGLDLELRYAAIRTHAVNHVCTGNTVYRAAALRAVGALDETLGYGYDNDLSYRLLAAGYRLVFCREAHAVHRWRDKVCAFLAQQYGFAYGRFDLIAKHPRRFTGDDVSGVGMLAHVGGNAAALAVAGISLLASALGRPEYALAGAASAVFGLLALERAVAGLRVWRRFGDWSGLLFVPAHFLRDVAWSTALLVWTGRRLIGVRSLPAHSMTVVTPSRQSSGI